MKRIGIVLIITILLVGVALQMSVQAAQPLLSIGSSNIQVGGTGSLNLSISGDTEGTYAGVNARVVLPEGVSVTGVSGGAGLPSGSFTVDHDTPSSSGNHEVTVIAYSGTSTFGGDSGAILSLNLAVSANTSTGNYPVKFATTNPNPLINSMHALSNADGSSSVLHAIQNGSLTVGSGGGGTDTDGDGIPDSLDPDDDNDGMEDVYEEKYGLNPLVDDSNGDLDKDGISNKQEHDEGSNPALDTKWVEFSSTVTEKGTFNEPYNTVGEGVQAVTPGGEVIIKTGTTDETPVIEKEVIIGSSGGEAVVGEQ